MDQVQQNLQGVGSDLDALLTSFAAGTDNDPEAEARLVVALADAMMDVELASLEQQSESLDDANLALKLLDEGKKDLDEAEDLLEVREKLQD